MKDELIGYPNGIQSAFYSDPNAPLACRLPDPPCHGRCGRGRLGAQGRRRGLRWPRAIQIRAGVLVGPGQASDRLREHLGGPGGALGTWIPPSRVLDRRQALFGPKPMRPSDAPTDLYGFIPRPEPNAKHHSFNPEWPGVCIQGIRGPGSRARSPRAEAGEGSDWSGGHLMPLDLRPLDPRAGSFR